MSCQAKGGKVIVFRFIAGARDGQTIRSDKPEEEKEVAKFWSITWNGTVGRRFDVASTHQPAYQRYQIISRYEVNNEVHLGCECVATI
jgi:hypothetical protein